MLWQVALPGTVALIETHFNGSARNPEMYAPVSVIDAQEKGRPDSEI
jgi:hypothetical protein